MVLVNLLQVHLSDQERDQQQGADKWPSTEANEGSVHTNGAQDWLAPNETPEQRRKKTWSQVSSEQLPCHAINPKIGSCT